MPWITWGFDSNIYQNTKKPRLSGTKGIYVLVDGRPVLRRVDSKTAAKLEEKEKTSFRAEAGWLLFILHRHGPGILGHVLLGQVQRLNVDRLRPYSLEKLILLSEEQSSE